MIIFLILLSVYLVCVFIVAGWEFAYWQGKYPTLAQGNKRIDLGRSILSSMLICLLGPLGVLVAFLAFGFAQYGWRLK